MKPGLWTVDRLKAAGLKALGVDPPTVTFTPQPWPFPTLLDQPKYSELFDEKYPGLAECLRELPGLVVAGPAAAWPLCDPDSDPSPIELYFVALSEPESESRPQESSVWPRLIAACARLLGRTDAPASFCLEPGLCRIEGPMSASFSLRCFRSMASLLASFAVSADAVAYDGRTAYLSPEAAHAHAYRVNTAQPARREGAAYEARLASLFRLGFALALPGLQPASLHAGSRLRLPHLELQVFTVRGAVASGRVTAATVPPPASSVRALERRALAVNVRRLAASPTPALLETAEATCASLPSLLDAFSQHSGTTNPYAVRHYLESASERALLPRAKLDVALLSEVFGMEPEEIGRVATAVARALKENPKASLRLAQALAARRGMLIARLVGVPERGWCLPDEPAEKDPKPESRDKPTDAAWYGAYWNPCETVSPAETKAASAETDLTVSATLEYAGGRYEGEADVCAVCQSGVARGSANSIRLSCGHTFHWGATSSCCGFMSWSMRKSTCPMCRASFDEPEEAKKRVNVSWSPTLPEQFQVAPASRPSGPDPQPQSSTSLQAPSIDPRPATASESVDLLAYLL